MASLVNSVVTENPDYAAIKTVALQYFPCYTPIVLKTQFVASFSDSECNDSTSLFIVDRQNAT